MKLFLTAKVLDDHEGVVELEVSDIPEVRIKLGPVEMLDEYGEERKLTEEEEGDLEMALEMFRRRRLGMALAKKIKY